MCGIIGVIGTQEAAQEAYLGLTALQHRGQDAAGILTQDENGLHCVKSLGLAENLTKNPAVNQLLGSTAIGHARYSTIGSGDILEVQPFLVNYPYGIGLVHNGNLVNPYSLSRELRDEKSRHLLTHSDSEVILNYLADGIARARKDKVNGPLEFADVIDSVKGIHGKCVGSYSVVSLIADSGIVAFRDPNGIRPLIWGKKKGTLPTGEAHCFASESAALSLNGYEIIRSLRPGEVIYIDKNGKIFEKVITDKPHRPCMFEWVYFASPVSIMDDIPVYSARIEFGKKLAVKVAKILKEKDLWPDVVAPVPDTSRTAALSIAESLGVPYREVMIKNRYIKRTFIMESQQQRKKAISVKLAPVLSEIKGKTVLLVDDSIVRGNTSKQIIEHARAAGAKKVIFVSTCPPLKEPCFYGIDFPSKEELIASSQSIPEVEKELGADALIYMDIEGLVESLKSAGGANKKFDRPCMACLDGNYPTDISESSELTKARIKDRKRSGESHSKKSVNRIGEGGGF